jgi:hypothetical protein
VRPPSPRWRAETCPKKDAGLRGFRLASRAGEGAHGSMRVIAPGNWPGGVAINSREERLPCPMSHRLFIPNSIATIAACVDQSVRTAPDIDAASAGANYSRLPIRMPARARPMAGTTPSTSLAKAGGAQGAMRLSSHLPMPI